MGDDVVGAKLVAVFGLSARVAIARVAVARIAVARIAVARVGICRFVGGAPVDGLVG